jgi:serine/threonine-protein kinase
MLGLIECEADRHEGGVARLERAVGLDPELMSAWMELARQRALAGDEAGALDLVRHAGTELPVVMLRIRVMMWFGRPELVDSAREAISRSRAESTVPAAMLAGLGALVGDASPADVVAKADESLPTLRPRYGALVCQLATEVVCHLGHPELASELLLRRSDLPLLDLRWLDRCPVLEPLRECAGFEQIRREVRVRIGQVWANV